MLPPAKPSRHSLGAAPRPSWRPAWLTALLGALLFLLPTGQAGENFGPATIAPPADPPPGAETAPSTAPARIVIPETYDQHFLVLQAGKQIGVEVAKSQIVNAMNGRRVSETVARETRLTAGGGTLHKKVRQTWVRRLDGFPLRYTLVIEEASRRVTLDADWSEPAKEMVYKVAGDDGAYQGAVAIAQPDQTVLHLDGVVLQQAGQLHAGGELTRYILHLYPPQFGLGRERARVVKKEAGPDGKGVVYRIEIGDASQPDGTPDPQAPPPRVLTVNELGHPLECVDFPIRRLAVRPDLAVMPAVAPNFANSLKPVPADPTQPVPTRAAEIDQLDRCFLILSASALQTLRTTAYQEVALETDQDRTVAVVKLQSVRADGRTPMLRLTAAERAAGLQPSSKIQSDHRDIQARAEAIEAAVLERYRRRHTEDMPATPSAPAMPVSERDYALVQAIGAWVYRRLEKKASGPADASALHALYYRHGDCTEHANLVVALARSRGLPARICRGLVLEGGELTAHQWAEIFVRDIGGPPAATAVANADTTTGLWLPVDATLGRIGVPAAYLLLGHDESALDGTLLTLMLDGDAVWMRGSTPKTP